MRSHLRFLALVALMLQASESPAQIGDGASFLKQCSQEALKKVNEQDKREYLYQLNYCVVFVTGVIHGHYASRAAYKQKPLFCLPQGRSPFELTGDVVAIIELQPQNHGFFAAALALRGLGEKYPCKD